jgi:hypothetical protein
MGGIRSFAGSRGFVGGELVAVAVAETGGCIVGDETGGNSAPGGSSE